MEDLTMQQVADRLNFSLSKVRMLVHTGQLLGYNSGRNVRVTEAELKAWRERQPSAKRS